MTSAVGYSLRPLVKRSSFGNAFGELREEELEEDLERRAPFGAGCRPVSLGGALETWMAASWS